MKRHWFRLKRSTWVVLFLVVSLVSGGVIAAIAGWRSTRFQMPSAAEAVKWTELNGAKPVTTEILALNPYRKSAGLAEVEAGWFQAQTGMIVFDGPSYIVLLDPMRRPARVIETQGVGWASPTYHVEYEVSGGKLNGKAAVWRGAPLRLFEVRTYRDNRVDGLSIYFDKEGHEICSCQFRKERPWTGRMLERDDFDHVSWDVSYLNGKLHGEEWQYLPDGRPKSLRTFAMGIPNGPERQYHEGILRSERIYDKGILRRSRSWHQNGNPESEQEFDAAGKRTGVYHVWDSDGSTKIEEHYQKGKLHGRRFWKGQGEVWFWENKQIDGKKEFDARQMRY